MEHKLWFSRKRYKVVKLILPKEREQGMNAKIKLHGLKTEEFIHSKEVKRKGELLENKQVQKLLKELNEQVSSFITAQRLGKYVRLSRKTAPVIYDILYDVCDILDYDEIPELYTERLYAADVIPCRAKRSYLLVPDFIINNFDTDMIYYAVGNAVTMLKAGHADISTMANFVPLNMLTAVPRTLIIHFLHAADMTSDRGGLLACQSISAAMRCHLIELGLPHSEIYNVAANDKKAEKYIPLLLKKFENLRENTIQKLSGGIQNFTYFEGAAAEMMSDLFSWYGSGYKQLMSKYGG